VVVVSIKVGPDTRVKSTRIGISQSVTLLSAFQPVVVLKT
jgi:hypothetical protein